MKPLRLSAEAFGPFGACVEVDFERIADLGLFVVSGDTGAGKTSIFDAMFYALYGTLPGDRVKDQHVRSDHASPDAECSVALEFLASGTVWRATRQPTQVRKKRRGDGTTEIKATALLERFDGTSWAPVASGVIDVDRQLQPVIGLSAAQFERVVLLPQGKFRRVLDASSVEREKLLRTLFGSELFDIATQQLRDSARQLTEGVREQSADHDRTLAAIAVGLANVEDNLSSRASEAGPNVSDAAPSNVLAFPNAINEDQQAAPSVSTPSTPTISSLKQQARSIEDGALRDLNAVVRDVSERSAAAAKRLATATSQVELLSQRDQLEVEQRALLDLAADHELRRAQVAEAERVAAFAAAHAREQQLIERCETLDRSSLAATATAFADAETAGVCSVAATESGAPADELDRLLVALHQRGQEVERCRQDAIQANRLDNQIDEFRNRLAGRRSELNTCQSVIDQWGTDLDSILKLRDELTPVAADLAHRESAVDHLARVLAQRADYDNASRDLHAATTAQQVLLGQADVLKAQRDAAQAPIDAGAAATAALVTLDRELDDTNRLVEAHQGLGVAMAEVAAGEAAAEATAGEATQLFAAFLDDAAPRLAADLAQGEQCPVCGSCEHPNPATSSPSSHAGASTVSAEAIGAAQDRANQALEQLSDARARVAQIVLTYPDLQDTTGHQLDQQIAELAARRRKQQAVVAAGDRASRKLTKLDAELSELARALDGCDTEVDRLQGVCDRLAGALGDHAGIEHADLVVKHSAALLLATRSADAAAELDRLADRRAQGDDAAADATRRVDDLRSEVSAVQAELTTAEGLLALAVDKVESEMAGADPAEVAAQIAAAVRAVQAAQKADNDSSAARVQLAEASSQSDGELQKCGHATPADALAGAIDAHKLAALNLTVRETDDHATRVADSLALLGQHSLPAVSPDIASLEAQAAAAAASLVHLQERFAAARTQLDQCNREIAQLEAGSQSHIEAQAAADETNRVASIVSGDNDQRMSLEAWVLAAYLRQVVDHANVHLDQMSNGRYALAVATEAADQRSRHGLDLVVVDAFTGTERPTRTLSGGESFQASLALALGLGDVVCHGRAGLHIDAMFIDEGFGTLDPKSVDQAVNVLDGLRSTGAMIGLITHVATVKEALPVAIEVGPSGEHAGSTIRQVA